MRCEARTVTEMCEDEATVRAGLCYEVLVRQAMKALTLHAFVVVAARNRQQLRHPRHRAVKRSVKTCNLRRVREFLCENFHERDFSRKMFRVERADRHAVPLALFQTRTRGRLFSRCS